MNQHLRPALVLLGLFTLLTGLVYPAVVTGIAQAVFPRQANGSLIEADGRVVGSSLIGQEFAGTPGYFWGRPSATGPVPYTAFNAETATGSSGSNLGPTNPALAAAVRARAGALRAADPGNAAPIPVDLVTASGSGLDPHVSPAGAAYQAARVARARGLAVAEVNRLVAAHTAGRTLGLLGEPRVNVLELNLALDRLRPSPPSPHRPRPPTRPARTRPADALHPYPRPFKLRLPPSASPFRVPVPRSRSAFRTPRSALPRCFAPTPTPCSAACRPTRRRSNGARGG